MISSWREAVGVCETQKLVHDAGLKRLLRAITALAHATETLKSIGCDDRLALATPYIRLFGVVAAAGTMTKGLAAAARAGKAPHAETRSDLSYFLDVVLPSASGFADMIGAGSAVVLAADFGP